MTKTVKRTVVLTSVRRHGSPTPCGIHMNLLISPSGGGPPSWICWACQSPARIWPSCPPTAFASLVAGGEQLCWSTEEADAVVAKVGASVEAVVRETARKSRVGVPVRHFGRTWGGHLGLGPGPRRPSRANGCRPDTPGWTSKPSPLSPSKWPDRGCCSPSCCGSVARAWRSSDSKVSGR